ncbi:MAG TPA: DUF1015 domain-containing protein [Myxococcota bacterium]|nr:DUF1015 domain-containing protein [Myxococcota bacterium]
MTDVRPFRALRYDPARVDLDRVIAPPYDVVNAEERAFYWERDPHGAIRLELTRDPDAEAAADYRDVAGAIAAWRRAGVLRLDEAPALYALRQRFAGPGGEPRAREGFFAALRLEPYERRIVRPHERTLAGPKADRLKLLRATRANLSPIFLLYEDPERTLTGLLAAQLDAGPAVEARDPAGVEHRLVPIREPAAIARVRGFLAERPVVIADGHHRYETALAYQAERRAAAGGEAGHDFVLAYLADAYAPGSLLLPIHRVVREAPAPDDPTWRARLPGWEEQRVPCPDPERLPALLAAHLAPLADRHQAFAADDGSGVLRIFARLRRGPEGSGAAAEAEADGEIGTRVLHAEVLAGVFGLDDAAVRDGAVGFAKQPLEAAREVRAGRGTVALYLNPLRPSDVFRVTAAGEVLPQKSTYFHPKLPTGLCFRLLDEDTG